MQLTKQESDLLTKNCGKKKKKKRRFVKCPVRLCKSIVNKMADQRNDRLTIDRAARKYLYAYR